MKPKKPLAWRWRMAANVVTFSAASLWLTFINAPGWVVILILYIATRPSRWDHADDVAALQSSIRKLTVELEELQRPADDKAGAS